MSAREPGSVKWGAVIGVGFLGLAVIAVCLSLGYWQWSRGFQSGQVIEASDPVPLADLVAPASAAGAGVGKTVTVEGQWADADVALVSGRSVDGDDAVMVVRPYTVSADATGTGEEATLPVVVGWLPPADVHTVSEPGDDSAIDGYLRGAEGVSGIADTPDQEIAGAFWSTTLSPAVFAQHWDSPLYSALLVAETPEEGLNALPAPAPDREVNFRSLTYAIEWWLFGAFFAFIAARWIRDNGRVPSAPATGDADTADPAHARKEPT